LIQLVNKNKSRLSLYFLADLLLIIKELFTNEIPQQNRFIKKMDFIFSPPLFIDILKNGLQGQDEIFFKFLNSLGFLSFIIK